MDDSRTKVRLKYFFRNKETNYTFYFSEYIPPTQVEVVTRRKALPLDENEGIYVRDIKSGRVRAVIGETYMLTQDEELWQKELPKQVEDLLLRDPLAERNVPNRNQASDKSQQQAATTTTTQVTSSKPTTKREKSKLITYRVPHNACVQMSILHYFH
jgi:major vault protein